MQGRTSSQERPFSSPRSLGGGLRSWLAVRWTRTDALRREGARERLRGLGGGSVRGSPCDGSARLRSGLPGSIPGRSRHSRAAASAPASLPSLTVPQRVRFGRAPRRKRRIDPLGARPLRQRTPGGRPYSALLLRPASPTARPVARVPATWDPGRCGGFRRAACGARKNLRRAEPAASGRRSRA